MAYLDEDILYNNVEEKYEVAKGEARSAYSDVLDTICEMPRADVVPKSEVAREIFEEIEKLAIRRMIPDVALIDDRLITDIAELKKKYTGEQT
jgi:hypothetical protein